MRMWKKLSLLLAVLLTVGALTGSVGLAKGAKADKADKAKQEQAVAAPETPPSGVYIADYGNVVSEADREVMAALGRELQSRCGVLVICLTEDVLEGAPVTLYAETVRKSWGLSERDSLVLFIRQGRKLHLANGKELAEKLSREQLDAAIAPAAEEMKKGQLSVALTRIYHNLVMTLAGVYLPPAEPGAEPQEMPAEEMPEEEAEEE